MISVVVISKDEPFLDETLAALERQQAAMVRRGYDVQVLVVDASSGRLDHVRTAHPTVSWSDFEPPPGVSVSIPHQRNFGVRTAEGDIIVFTDAGCVPLEGWLDSLVCITEQDNEDVVVGATKSKRDEFTFYTSARATSESAVYLRECATINLAFRRKVFDAVGGFDESFRYGSDVDFSWRVVDAGYRLRSAPDAVVEVDWGDWKRQLRRSYSYGRARIHLYRKHRSRLHTVLRDDPVVVFWPAFILGLPISVRYPAYLLLLLVPVWRNRRHAPVRTVVDHLAYGTGALAALAGR